MKKITKFKFLPHTADIKFQAYGKNLEEVYENSAYAMMGQIFSNRIKEKKKKKFEVSGKDLESLMYNFLEEFLYLIDAEKFICGKVKVKISKDRKNLKAEVYGDDVKNYKTEMSIKAVTYNDMFVKKIKNQWVSQVVLDV